MDKKKYIGIDPGTLVTGYALVEVETTSLKLIDFGCIRPPASKRLSERYSIIYDSVKNLIEIHSPHYLAIETQFVDRNPQSAIKLGMACGIALLAAIQAGLEIYEYAPKRVKKAVTGNGNASKNQIQWMVQKVFSLPSPPTPFDAADALALTICHYHAMQTSQLLERF